MVPFSPSAETSNLLKIPDSYRFFKVSPPSPNLAWLYFCVIMGRVGSSGSPFLQNCNKNGISNSDPGIFSPKCDVIAGILAG